MKRARTTRIALEALSLIALFTATGCPGSGGGESTIETFTLSTGWGVRYDLTVDAAAGTYDFVNVATPEDRFALDCPTKGPRFATLQCTVSITDDETNTPVGTPINLLRYEGLFFGLFYPGNDGSDPERVVGGASTLWIVDTRCDALLSGTFTKAGFSSGFSVLQMDAAAQLVRHADFGFVADGSTFKANYSTLTSAGSGLENVTNHTCNEQGHHRINLIDNGSNYYFDLLQTPSEVLVYSQHQLAGPIERAAKLSDLAGKKFRAFYTSLTDSEGSNQMNITFSAENSGTLSISKFETTETAAFPSGLRQGLTLASVSNPLAGNRFATVLGAKNGLRTEFPKAADLPGIFYLNVAKPDATVEVPLVISAFKTKRGKLVLSGLQYDYNAAAYTEGARFFAVEQ